MAPATARAERLVRRPSARSRSRAVWRRRLVLLLAAIVALAAAYLLWLRDSGLVAVNEVRVEGLTSTNQEQIRSTLEGAAQGMTTLHVDVDELEAAVSQFPTVESVSADPDFPHGLRIEVTEREPVALVEAAGEELAVAGDGTVLAGVEAAELDLPTLAGAEAPSSGRLEADALEVAGVLGAAPEPLRPVIERGSRSEAGVEVELEGGIELRFGSAARAAAKWAAASSVLADPDLEGLSYIELRVPERPAVGGAAISEP
jgi:cell division protein FtsQ